jgi:tetratricopeptide (TPR) repeat protein
MKEKYSIIRSADRYIELRQYKKAIKVYQSLIDSGELDPSVINNLGDLQYRNGDQASALKNYSQAAAIYSDSGDALKAVGICRKILRIDSFNDDILNLILDLNQRREAAFDSKGIINDLIKTAVEGEHYGRASTLQEKLIGTGDKTPSALVRLAELRFLAGSKNQASEEIQRALDSHSADSPLLDSWDWITDLMAVRNCSEEFQQFVTNMKTGYVPSEPEIESMSKHGVEIGESPPPLPVSDVDTSLNSPEFFEVDGSIGLEDEIQETIEDGAISHDFIKDEEAPSPPEIPSSDVEAEEEPDAESGIPEEIFALGEEEETSESAEGPEFEFNLDEGVLAGSPEEILKMLEAETEIEETPGENEIEVNEGLSEDFAAAVDEAPDEKEEFELDLDKEDLVLDYGDLGIVDLDETAAEVEEPELTAADDESIGEEDQEPDSGQSFLIDSEPETDLVDKVSGESNEIENALEDLFVSGGQDGGSFSTTVPEGIAQQEYPADDALKGRGKNNSSGGDSFLDHDDDPDVQVELGIAYRDMALLDDAIGKFEKALAVYEEQGEKDKCVLCAQLLAECCNSLEQFRETLKWVARGLDYRKVSEDEIVYFEYESAIALESLGDYSEGLRGYRRIQSIHPGFRDVESRISGLESAGH